MQLLGHDLGTDQTFIHKLTVFHKFTVQYNIGQKAHQAHARGTYQPVRLVVLAYKSWLISQRTVFFSHTKPANSTFSHGL